MFLEKKWRNSKFSPLGVEGVLLGFNPNHLSYKIFIPSTNNIHQSHHVKFLPNVFPFRDVDTSTPSVSPPLKMADPSVIASPSLDLSIEEPDDSPALDRITSNPEPGEMAASPPPDSPPPAPLPIYKHHTLVPWYNTAPKEVGLDISSDRILPTRRRHQANIITNEPTHHNDPKTISKAWSWHDWPGWKAAITVEHNNCVRHKVWEIVPKPANARELNTTWVLKTKFDANGDFLKMKARLCAQGFRQVEGIDYNNTFAPTGRLPSLRIILTLLLLST